MLSSRWVSLRPDTGNMPPGPTPDTDPGADKNQPPELPRPDPVSGRSQMRWQNISRPVTPSRRHTMFLCASDFTGMKLLVCQAWQSAESDTGNAAPKEMLGFKGGAEWVWWQLHWVGTGSCDPVSGRNQRISAIMGLCDWKLTPALTSWCRTPLDSQPPYVWSQNALWLLPALKNHSFSSVLDTCPWDAFQRRKAHFLVIFSIICAHQNFKADMT